MLLKANQVSRARLMATAQKESGSWLDVWPVSSLGTLLDSESFRVAIAIRVGADVLYSSFLPLWADGWTVGVCMACPAYTVLATIQGIRQWMMWLKKRALQKAILPSVLEPAGLDKGDGSRPDSISVSRYVGVGVLFGIARVLILLLGCTWIGQRWKLGCKQHRGTQMPKIRCSSRGTSVWAKCSRYDGSVWWVHHGVIMRAIGRRLVEATGKPREVNWFRQNLAKAIQRGIAFSILSASRERF